MQDTTVISKVFDWYLMNVMPIVEEYAIQPTMGYHGLYTHTAAVVFRGIDYAIHLNQDPKYVVMACAFHDMARENDGWDFEHGINAIPMAQKAMDKIGDINDDVRKSIIYAVKEHSVGKIAPDYISACLWDADRTRLAWECEYNPMFFNTDRAKIVASRPAQEYLDFMRENMSEYAQNRIYALDEFY